MKGGYWVTYTNMKSNGKEKHMLVYTKDLVVWLANLLNLEKELLVILLHYHSKMFRIIRTRGKKEAIKYLKSTRLIFLKYLFNGFSFDGLDVKVPKPLIRYAKVSKGNRLALKALLSVLYLSRCIRLKPEPSFSTIEKAPGYQGNPSELRGSIFLFLKEIGMNPYHLTSDRIPRRVLFQSFHLSTKAGPNGIAMWSSLHDFKQLPEELIDSLKIIGGDIISEKFDALTLTTSCKGIMNFFGNFKGNSFRKLIVISDKEGKSREVAIADYWTQTCLRPLHEYLASILKNIKQDCTFNQSKWIKDFNPHPGHMMHSVDLSSATDRFPIDIQYEIIRWLTNKFYADSWKKIMVGFPFDSQFGKISYQTGNPMGFYSSFTSFALAHHYLVWLSCRKTNIPYRTLPYMMLGDDIVIGNDNVCKEYMSLLREWDIPFSEEKTHTSKFGFEFAKQIRYKGNNISPLSLSSFYNNRNDYKSCISFLVEELKMKEWNVDTSVWIESYLRKFHKFSSKRYKRLLPDITLSLGILDYLQGGSISLGDHLRDHVSRYYSSPSLNNPVIMQVYSNEVLRLMLIKEKESRMRNGAAMFDAKSKQSMLRLIMTISFNFSITDVFHVQESIPFLSYYHWNILPILIGKKEEKPLSVIEQFSPSLMKKIYAPDIRPISVSDYYKRHRNVDYSTSWEIAKQFRTKSLEVSNVKVFGRPIDLKLVPINRTV